MPRPKKIGGPEPKKRSRNGCWPCKAKKVKCGEEKPGCLNCQRQGETCDYSIRLNWDGRAKRKADSTTPEPSYSMPRFQSLHQIGATSAPSTFPPAAVVESTADLETGQVRNSSGATLCKLDGQGQEFNEIRRQRDGSPSITPLQPSSGSSINYPNLNISPSTVGTTLAQSTPMHDKHSSSLNGDNSSINSSDDQRLKGLSTTKSNSNAARLPRIKDFGPAGIYPSPEDSNLDGLNNKSTLNPMASPPPVSMAPMLPPHQIPSLNSSSSNHKDWDYTCSPGNRAKRIRLSPLSGSANIAAIIDTQAYDTSAFPPLQFTQTKYMPPLPPSSPYKSNVATPLTPASSSATSEDGHPRVPMESPSYSHRDSLDLRRLSVNSLLSGPPGNGSHTATRTEQVMNVLPYPFRDIGTETVTYGLDRGFPDLDVSKNDDKNAINGISPTVVSDNIEVMVQNCFGDDFYAPTEFGFGLQAKDTVFGKGGYYAKPVPVKIPRSLEPLPATLLQNPMNLLYFHHFLNHTARILVPHDCSENPFRKILPQMALENVNLLNLLLAYSASHRARLLNQPEPANRIAIWVQDVFPTLRLALYDSKEKISNANLATAIMLASLEIISPNTFEVPVPWQNHLNTARRMIIARGGAQSVHRQDKVSYFLSRWFAYLDVLGSLSGSKNDRPLFSGNYWANDDLDNEDDFQIDCLLGFTSRCVSILAKIAELARQCHSERIDPNGHIRTAWLPSPATVAAAEKLQRNLQDARTHVYKGCAHRHSHSESEEGWDSLEMVATNDAFHWAGLVHLHRRVLGKPSSDPQVQDAVREIVGALYKVRKGSTAEACLLFPMFTAGCDARAQSGQREKIMERIASVEGFGMTQVRKARTLMQKVWDTGRPWETLVTGEFFG